MKRVVILGDGYVGKTSILHAIKEMEFTEHIPSVYDEFEVQGRFEGKAVQLKFIDTAGQEEFDLFRRLSYTDADLFLLCFAIDDPVSFENLETKWIQDLELHKRTPIILVATKCDLIPCVDDDRIAGFQKKIGAIDYVRCSGLKGTGIRELKSAAVKAMFAKNKSCTIQ